MPSKFGSDIRVNTILHIPLTPSLQGRKIDASPKPKEE